MKRWKLPLLAVFLVFASEAQNTGTLTGKLLNTQNQPVSAASVIVQKDGKIVTTQVTDAQGVFHFSLPAGDYVIQSASATKAISILSNKTTTANLLLTANTDLPAFSDEPQFTVAGVADNTYRGGHGSDTVLRSSETLTKETKALGSHSPSEAASEPHHSLAESAERAGRFLDAAREFQTAAELNPSEPNLFDWGTELLSHKAPLAAAEIFTKGSKLFPQSLRMLLGLATSWYAAGDYDKAARCFFEAIDSHPDNPAPYTFLSETASPAIKESVGYHQRLVRFYESHPESALANYYYANSLKKQVEDSELVISLLQKAISLDPHMYQALLMLGVLYSEQGKYTQAIPVLQESIRQNPDAEEAHYRLSKAYGLTGDSGKAADELAIFHKLSKQSSAKVEQERRDIRQFVIALKTTSH